MQKTAPTLEMIEMNPSTKATATVIWLHGLGADGNDFAPIVPELQLPNHLGVRFVFPYAPMQAVTINNGYIMRAWYDIVSMEVARHADQRGIATSVAQINQLIEREEQLGIPSERIILAGFSQGAVIALTAGMTYQKKLAGIIALSGYLPGSDQIIQQSAIANKSIPIFLAHGTEDPVVPFFLGQMTHEILTKHQYSVDWHSYPMPHSVCMQEIKDIGLWLKDRFPLSRE
jgi:phospholipase/carboxylesterase